MTIKTRRRHLCLFQKWNSTIDIKSSSTVKPSKPLFTRFPSMPNMACGSKSILCCINNTLKPESTWNRTLYLVWRGYSLSGLEGIHSIWSGGDTFYLVWRVYSLSGLEGIHSIWSGGDTVYLVCRGYSLSGLQGIQYIWSGGDRVYLVCRG